MQLFQEIMKLGNSDNLKTIIFIITSFLKTFGSTGFLSGQSNHGVRRLKNSFGARSAGLFCPFCSGLPQVALLSINFSDHQ